MSVDDLDGVEVLDDETYQLRRDLVYMATEVGKWEEREREAARQLLFFRGRVDELTKLLADKETL